MVVKIFYFLIALFSVSVVFLTLQSPYSFEKFKEKIVLADMQANSVLSYELNATKTYAKYAAKNITRFSDHDLAQNFSGVFLQGNRAHFLASNNVKITGDIFNFYGDATYKNSDDLKYTANEIIYDAAAKTLRSHSDFRLTQGANTMIGSDILYKINEKEINAKRIKSWLQR